MMLMAELLRSVRFEPDFPTEASLGGMLSAMRSKGLEKKGWHKKVWHKKETPHEAGFRLGFWPGQLWANPPLLGLSSEPRGSVLSHGSRVFTLGRTRCDDLLSASSAFRVRANPRVSCSLCFGILPRLVVSVLPNVSGVFRNLAR